MKKAIFLLFVLVGVLATSCKKDDRLPNSGTLIIQTAIEGYDRVEGMNLKIYDGEGTDGFLVSEQIYPNPLLLVFDELSAGTYTVVANWTGAASRVYTDSKTVYLGVNNEVRVELMLK